MSKYPRVYGTLMMRALCCFETSVLDYTVLQGNIPLQYNSEKLLLMGMITFDYAAHTSTAHKFNLSYMIVSHFLVYLFLELEYFQIS